MRAKWFSLGCLSSIIIVILMIVLSVRSVIKMANVDKIEKAPSNMVLHLKLKGMVKEFAAIQDQMFDIVEPNAHVLIQKIKKAKNDPNVRGLLLEPEGMQIGLATLNELSLAIKDFKTSGKPVYAYLNMVSDRDYMFASNADEISMTPSSSAGILLTGVGGKRIYWKETFDKLGVEYQVIHAGQYKGAGENYVRTKMSDPVRKSITDLYDDVYGEILSYIATNRNISVDEISQIYESREEIFIRGQQAIDYKLIDKLEYRDNIYKRIETGEVELYSIGKYKVDTSAFGSNKIAVVYANGTITPVKGNITNNTLNAKQLNPVLETIMNDDSIRAVVLRVNSPGGSALESDLMWNKIEELKKKKPVVVSMGDVAASGGYFISAPGEVIFADPFTITGSIGVVAMIPNASKLGEKVGINLDGVSKGKYRDLINVWEPMSAETKRALKFSINDTYKEFKSRVKEGRGMDEATLEPIAQGRVWSAEDAHNNKLVDNIGTLDDAIAKAAEIAKTDNYTVAYFPEVKTLIEYYLEDKLDLPIMKTFLSEDLPKEFIDAIQFKKEIEASPIQMRSPIVDDAAGF